MSAAISGFGKGSIEWRDRPDAVMCSRYPGTYSRGLRKSFVMRELLSLVGIGRCGPREYSGEQSGSVGERGISDGSMQYACERILGG